MLTFPTHTCTRTQSDFHTVVNVVQPACLWLTWLIQEMWGRGQRSGSLANTWGESTHCAQPLEHINTASAGKVQQVTAESGRQQRKQIKHQQGVGTMGNCCESCNFFGGRKNTNIRVSLPAVCFVWQIAMIILFGVFIRYDEESSSRWPEFRRLHNISSDIENDFYFRYPSEYKKGALARMSFLLFTILQVRWHFYWLLSDRFTPMSRNNHDHGNDAYKVLLHILIFFHHYFGFQFSFAFTNCQMQPQHQIGKVNSH